VLRMGNTPRVKGNAEPWILYHSVKTVAGITCVMETHAE